MWTAQSVSGAQRDFMPTDPKDTWQAVGLMRAFIFNLERGDKRFRKDGSPVDRRKLSIYWVSVNVGPRIS
jgi:hypothetical protein